MQVFSRVLQESINKQIQDNLLPVAVTSASSGRHFCESMVFPGPQIAKIYMFSFHLFQKSLEIHVYRHFHLTASFFSQAVFQKKNESSKTDRKLVEIVAEVVNGVIHVVEKFLKAKLIFCDLSSPLFECKKCRIMFRGLSSLSKYFLKIFGKMRTEAVSYCFSIDSI